MKLKSSNSLCWLFVIFFLFTPLKGEEKIDIWNNKDKKQSVENNEQIKKRDSQKLNLESIKTIELNQNIKIEDQALEKDNQENKLYGVYDPAENDFNLNMWSSTKAEDVQASLNRLEKIKLSKTANQILERILLSFSYAPEGMSNEKFADLFIKSFLIFS